MNIYFHAIFYIKLYVRIMFGRYLCILVGPNELQITAPISPKFKLILQVSTPSVLVDTCACGYTVVFPAFVSDILHRSEPTGIHRKQNVNNRLILTIGVWV